MKAHPFGSHMEPGEPAHERPLNAYEHRTCEGRYQKLRRDAIAVLPLTVFFLAQTVLGLGACGIEIALLHKFFSLAFEPLPGEVSTWSAGLLALTGLSMIAAYHLHASAAPASMAVRFIRRAVDLCLPLYALGLGAAVLSIVYLNTGAIFEPMDMSRELFSLGASAAPPPFLEKLLPHLGTLFAVAMGAFAIINLFVSTRLLELAVTNALKVYHALSKFRLGHKAILTTRATQKRRTALMRVRAARADELRTLRVAAANEIVSAIQAALRPKVEWIGKHENAPEPEPNRLVEQAARVLTQPTAKRVAQLQAITVKQVLAAIDSNNALNTTPGENR